MTIPAARKICYLCGKSLSAPISRDHVPPRQLYADDVRKRHSPNLLTIPVHGACNAAYQLDEDYFVNTLMPFAKGSYSGNAVYAETLRKFKAGEQRKLIYRVLREFEHRPSGIVLPAGKIAKRFEGTRIHRVAWKIVRGLYFHHHQTYLAPDLPSGLRMVLPGQEPPPDFVGIINEPTHGQYPGVFDYRFATFPEVNKFHYWAMLLWDRLLLLFTFHDPSCPCESCTAKRQNALENRERHASAAP